MKKTLELVQQANKLLAAPLELTTQLDPLKELMDHQISAEDFDLSQRMEQLNRGRSWSFDELYQHPNFHINLLMIPKGKMIPLHDHPKMHVLLKVLWGNLHLTSYDWAEEFPYEGIVRQTQNGVYDGSSETFLITPKNNNIHQIQAEEDCAFLDVLSPAYSEDAGRPCHYYRKQKEFSHNGEKFFQLVSA